MATGSVTGVAGRPARAVVRRRPTTAGSATGSATGVHARRDCSRELTGAPGCDEVAWVNLPRRHRSAARVRAQRELGPAAGSPTPVAAPQPGQDRVVPLDGRPRRRSTRCSTLPCRRPRSRPGHRAWSTPGTAIWAGEHAGGLRRRPQRPGTDRAAVPVGVLGGVAVHPDHRRRGLGGGRHGRADPAPAGRSTPHVGLGVDRRQRHRHPGVRGGWATPTATP